MPGAVCSMVVGGAVSKAAVRVPASGKRRAMTRRRRDIDSDYSAAVGVRSDSGVICRRCSGKRLAVVFESRQCAVLQDNCISQMFWKKRSPNQTMKSSLLFLCAGILSAQTFSVGVKGGVPLTGDLGSYYATSESRRYTVGPMVTAGLPLRFRLEFAALYRRVGFRASDGFLGGSYTERDRGNSWEFPIVVRRTLWRGVYAGIGYAPRVINGSSHANYVFLTSIAPEFKTFSELTLPGSWDTTHGAVSVVGIEKRVGRLHIAPEVRYTRWNKQAVDVNGSRGFSIQSTQNQVDLLVGIRFP